MSDITPRILIEYTLETRDGDVDHRAYEALQPSGTLNGGKFHRQKSLGYGEFEPGERIGRHTDKDEFIQTVKEKAEYIHFKNE